jgi:hypothetical protein
MVPIITHLKTPRLYPSIPFPRFRYRSAQRSKYTPSSQIGLTLSLFSESLDSSAKPVLSPNRYSQPALRAAPSTTATSTAQPSIPQPLLPPSQAHGYIGSGLDTQSHLHPHLRSTNSGLVSDMMQRGTSSTSEELGPVSGSPTASTMAAHGIIGHDPDDSITDGRKAKRELSQSKRAAQNRAAQVSMQFNSCPSSGSTSIR